jgi:uncharacterized protein
VIVVSNTSPIMNLSVVGHLPVLERLYGKVLIPDAVSSELLAIASNTDGLSEFQSYLWIEKHNLRNRLLAESLRLELDNGEAEAIALAVESGAGLLLIDERRGRNVAARFGLKYVGLLGILVEAKHRGIIHSLKPVVDNLISKAGFWIKDSLYLEVLRTAGEKEND